MDETQDVDTSMSVEKKFSYYQKFNVWVTSLMKIEGLKSFICALSGLF